MSIDPREATASLNDIADVERRTRQAIFYFGSSTIFVMWGLLVACGYALGDANVGYVANGWPNAPPALADTAM